MTGQDPRIVMVSIITACGRIRPATMGSALDRSRLEQMRMVTDASLMGAETLRQGDPEMRGPEGRLPEGRTRAIMTMSGNIPVEGKRLFQSGPPPVIFTDPQKTSTLTEALQGKARVISLPRGPQGLSVRAAVSELRREGAKIILVEGGARLNYAALAEGIIDEIYLTIAPRLSGKEGVASLADGPVSLGDPFVNLRLLECGPANTGEIFLRYEVDKGSQKISVHEVK